MNLVFFLSFLFSFPEPWCRHRICLLELLSRWHSSTPTRSSSRFLLNGRQVTTEVHRILAACEQRQVTDLFPSSYAYHHYVPTLSDPARPHSSSSSTDTDKILTESAYLLFLAASPPFFFLFFPTPIPSRLFRRAQADILQRPWLVKTLTTAPIF